MSMTRKKVGFTTSTEIYDHHNYFAVHPSKNTRTGRKRIKNSIERAIRRKAVIARIKAEEASTGD